MRRRHRATINPSCTSPPYVSHHYRARAPRVQPYFNTICTTMGHGSKNTTMSTPFTTVTGLNTWACAAREAAHHSMDARLTTALIDVIEDALHAKVSPGEAARTFAGVIEPAVRSASHGWCKPKVVSSLWRLLGDAARACGQSRSQQLADLVISIAALDVLLGEDGKPIVNEEKSLYWKDLPWFVLSIRYSIAPEWFNGLCLDEGGDLDTTWQTQAEPLLNATAFIGMLLTRMDSDQQLLPTVWLCLNASLMNPELEKEIALDGDPYRVESRLDQRSHVITVGSAAKMVLIAGTKIWKICQSVHVMEDGRRFDEEHWLLWQNSFAARSDVEVFPFELRALCVQTAALMQHIRNG